MAGLGSHWAGLSAIGLAKAEVRAGVSLTLPCYFKNNVKLHAKKSSGIFYCGKGARTPLRAVLELFFFLPQSRRDYATKPRVARNELPWETAENILQPQRGCVGLFSNVAKLSHLLSHKVEEGNELKGVTKTYCFPQPTDHYHQTL